MMLGDGDWQGVRIGSVAVVLSDRQVSTSHQTWTDIIADRVVKCIELLVDRPSAGGQCPGGLGPGEFTTSRASEIWRRRVRTH